MSVFIALQGILFLFMILHDWVDAPPLTDLAALRKAHSFRERVFGSVLNGILVLIPLLLSIAYRHSNLPLWVAILFVAIYGLITFGTITAWWIPYFGGGYLMHGNRAGFEEYRNTHSFLPKRGENVVPNTLHALLHVQVWTCFVWSVVLLLL